MWEQLLPVVAAVIGVLVSWALASGSPFVAWFQALPGWGKIAAVVVIAVLYGAAMYFGFDADLVNSIQQVLWLVLGSQVGYVMLPSKK